MMNINSLTKSEKIKEVLFDPDFRFMDLSLHGFYKNLSDEQFLNKKFKIVFGKDLNLSNPLTFNEKMQWLKIYDRKPIYTTMVDKYEAKTYASNIIGNQYIIPTLGVWERFDDINFDTLPEKFVIKTTHDSGGVVIVTDKHDFNKNAARKKINFSLKRDYYYVNREWPYKNVKHRIIAEEYINDKEDINSLTDYKLMCFNGKVRCTFTGTERRNGNLKVTFFDNDWNILPFERYYPKSEVPIPKPIHFEEMKSLAEKLSHGIPFLRVDFYETKDRFFLGELTFYPGSGFEEFNPERWDYILGSWLTLPNKAI